MAASSAVNAYVVSAIAVLGTLFGAFTAGIFQYLATKRQLRWQAHDAELRRLADLEKWAHVALEDRHKSLWSERRAAYSALAEAAEAWIASNRDLRDAVLPEVAVATVQDASAASPVVAEHFRVSQEYKTRLLQVELMGHESVVQLARELHLSLIRTSKAALRGERLQDSEPVKMKLLATMRYHLTESHMPPPKETAKGAETS